MRANNDMDISKHSDVGSICISVGSNPVRGFKVRDFLRVQVGL